MRIFKTSNKKEIAQAYGFSKQETLVNHVNKRLAAEPNPLIKKKLKKFTGHLPLLPDQVEAIVNLLGTPQHPTILYSEV
jgi:hypothetical protein